MWLSFLLHGHVIGRGLVHQDLEEIPLDPGAARLSLLAKFNI